MSYQQIKSRRRRRWRIAIEALVVAAGVVLLVWGANSLARVGAESLLERSIKNATGVAFDPDVELGKGFVLPQAIRGAYREVHVTVRGIQSGPLRVQEVDANLYDVRLPFRNLVLRDIRRIGIGRSVDEVTLSFQDINTYFEVTGQAVRLSGTKDGEVRLIGFFIVLGQTVRVTGTADLSVDGSQLRVDPAKIDTGDASMDQLGRLFLDQRLHLTVPLDTLPFGYELTQVRSDEDDVVLTAESRNIVLRP
ncbi:MAG: DUF2993 domain-containing protein [Microlunatus sp.]|nr:DUF2993 domain-containing protein [Microlunatus sp.]MDN5770888.1 DUF2993 domain-containing protein [Microlunatus sp.]MDN5804944.1 DUF2993 domain-containing protein [Microlunatus sp.]